MAFRSRHSPSVQDENQSPGNDLSGTQRTARAAQHRVIGVVRIFFGVAWAVAALLKWQPAFTQSFANTISGTLAEQPAAIHTWVAIWSGLIHTNPVLFGYLAALTESLLAICFILGLFTNVACVISMSWAFMVWSVAESFGSPFVPGQSTDIGTAFPYILLSALLLVMRSGLYFGLDRKLTKCLGRYGFLASGPWQKITR